MPERAQRLVVAHEPGQFVAVHRLFGQQAEEQVFGGPECVHDLSLALVNQYSDSDYLDFTGISKVCQKAEYFSMNWSISSSRRMR
jgi:hypothetical protein